MRELPIRSKLQMIEDIIETIRALHKGEKEKADIFLEDLKKRALFLDPDIQNSVLIFSEQVAFQYAYDPWHKVTPDIQRAADHLIEDLGFVIDSETKSGGSYVI